MGEEVEERRGEERLECLLSCPAAEAASAVIQQERVESNVHPFKQLVAVCCMSPMQSPMQFVA